MSELQPLLDAPLKVICDCGIVKAASIDCFFLVSSEERSIRFSPCNKCWEKLCLLSMELRSVMSPSGYNFNCVSVLLGVHFELTLTKIYTLVRQKNGDQLSCVPS